MNTTSTLPKYPATKISTFLITLLVASFILAYFPVWKSLVMTWYGSDDYSHGFFVVPICLYIIWKKKAVVASISFRPSGWGLGLVFLSVLLYLMAHFGEIKTVSSFSMILFLGGTAIYISGFGMLKELLFPLALLLFMIPVPAQIYAKLTIPLQLFVSKASVWVAGSLGVAVYREGNIIHVPGGTLQVVQACSGLRSMVALLTISAVYGYFALRSNPLRVMLFICGIPAAIIVNIFRVLLLVVAFEYFHADLTHGTAHTVLGIVVFALALGVVAGVKGILGHWDISATIE